MGERCVLANILTFDMKVHKHIHTYVCVQVPVCGWVILWKCICNAAPHMKFYERKICLSVCVGSCHLKTTGPHANWYFTNNVADIKTLLFLSLALPRNICIWQVEVLLLLMTMKSLWNIMTFHLFFRCQFFVEIFFQLALDFIVVWQVVGLITVPNTWSFVGCDTLYSCLDLMPVMLSVSVPGEQCQQYKRHKSILKKARTS